MDTSHQHHRTTFNLWKIENLVEYCRSSGALGHLRWFQCSLCVLGRVRPRHAPGCGALQFGRWKWDGGAQWRQTTRAARFQQGCGRSAPDITIVNSEAADRFSWQPHNELSSDHSPILIKWNQVVKSQRVQRRLRPNFQKADWNLLGARLAEYQPLLKAIVLLCDMCFRIF